MWNYVDKGNGNLLSEKFIPKFSFFKLNFLIFHYYSQDKSFFKVLTVLSFHEVIE